MLARSVAIPAREDVTVVRGVHPPVASEALQLQEILVICAEPGMGKTYTASWIMRWCKSLGYEVHQYSLEDMEQSAVVRRVSRTCREFAGRGKAGARILVVFDGITPCDEFETASIARYLERLHESCQVVVCLRPEAEQLVEALPGCVCLRNEDLVYRFDDEGDQAWELTGGIAPLYLGVRFDESHGKDARTGARYALALEKHIGSLVRTGIPEEERRLRLAGLLLGSGTMGDLALVAGRCDTETLALLARDVPLYGIDLKTRTFEVHGLADEEVLRRCMHALQPLVANCPEMVVRACGLLVSSGRVRRAAIVCGLCASEEDYASMGARWGVSFVEAGEGTLVEEALRVSEVLGRVRDTRLQLSEAAVVALSGSGAEVDEVRERMEHLGLSTLADQKAGDGVRLLLACRDLLRGPRRVQVAHGTLAHDAMVAGCLDHLAVARHLVAGRFGEAYSMTSNEMTIREPTSLSASLVSDDVRLALLLSGGVPDAREAQRFAQADRFFAHMGMERIRAYHAALAEMPQVLMAEGRESSALEEAATRADRAGDRYFQALCLGVLAICDLHLRAWSRAHVRAEQAGIIAKALGETYLAAAAELADALALEMLGEQGALGRWCAGADRPVDLLLLVRIAAREVGELPAGTPELLVPMGMPCPRDAFWAIGLLAFDCQALSESIMGGMPASWLDLVRAVRTRQRPLFEADEEVMVPQVEIAEIKGKKTLREGEQTRIELPEQAARRVRVFLFGGFGIEVEGRPVSDKMLERRRARDLMILLAIAPGHRLRRYQAIDILWPDSDYYKGPRKLYEATSEVRKCLAHYLGGQNAIVADRAQGTVGLDGALVSCDIDEFEREARLTLAEDGDDFWVLDHARRMSRLYASGPDLHLTTLGERVVDRFEELKTLYVDAAVAAGEAALRLGKAKLAVRYAMDAHRMRELREDAMLLLVHALRSSGRGHEVNSLYRRYARRLIEEEGTPPSLALRRAAALATNEGPEVLTGWGAQARGEGHASLPPASTRDGGAVGDEPGAPMLRWS